MKKLLLTLSVMVLSGWMASGNPIPPDSLYLGQTPPGNTPQLFAPGIVSVPGRTEYGISISPAGDEMLFALGNWPNKRTMILKYENNRWTAPDTVSFSTTRSAEEAIYSPGGQRVYYYAYNPPSPVGGADLCYSIKTGGTWSEPINLGTSLNTVQDEYHPCIVADSSVYFENVSGKICYAKFQNGAYLPRVILPAMFNDPTQAWGNPYVAPDESYFLFNSSRPGGYGGTDLYIAYKKDDGTWTNPKNLGNVINTAVNECGSEITDDLLYMTYVSNNDIYWVGSGFIDSLRYTNFAPYALNTIPDQTAWTGISFTFSIPDTTFLDDDGDLLIYHAGLLNGNPLPAWLAFDTLTGTFTGTPQLIETLFIRITATDPSGASASTTLKISCLPPVSTGPGTDFPRGNLVYPNPSAGVITIDLRPSTRATAVAEVCTLLGEVIATRVFDGRTQFDLSGCPPGIYLVRITQNDTRSVSRVCIRR